MSERERDSHLTKIDVTISSCSRGFFVSSSEEYSQHAPNSIVS